MARDLFLVQNVFPEDVARVVAWKRGVALPDSAGPAAARRPQRAAAIASGSGRACTTTSSWTAG